MPAVVLSNSTDKCIAVPLPGVAYAILPGFFLAKAINSAMLVASKDGFAAMRRCCTDTWVTPERSFSVSNGMLERRLGLITCAVTTMPIVYPSGGDLPTYA